MLSSIIVDTLLHFLHCDWFVIPKIRFVVKQYLHPIKNIKAKILWCHDEDDTMTLWLDAKKVMDQQHYNIEFIVTKGFGHKRIYGENKVSKAIIEFL